MSGDPMVPEPRPKAWGVPPIIWKGGVVLYLIFLFGLAAVYLTVASQGVEYSITVAGDEEVCVGGPAALRVGVMDLSRGVYMSRAPLEVHLRSGKARHRLFTGFTSPAGLADVNLEIPADVAAGDAHWEVVVPTPDDTTETGSVAVKLSTCASARMMEAVEVDEGGKVKNDGTGPLRIEPVAEGGTLVDGLPSTLFLQVTSRETGEPVRATVKIELVKGLIDGTVQPKAVTDPGGVAAVRLTPVGNQKWRFTVEHDGATSVRELILESKPTQHVLTVASPVWRADSDLRVSVKSLRRSGELYGDLYGPAANWVHGVVAGVGANGGGFHIPARVATPPPAGISVVHVQAYADPLGPGGAGDMRYLVVPAAGVSERDVLAELLGRAADDPRHALQAKALAASPWLLEATQSALHRHIAFWLSLYPRDFHQPIVLMDSRTGQMDEIARTKDSARDAITWLLGISGGLGLLVVLWLVVGNFIAVRRAGQFAAAELDLEEMGGLQRAQAIIQLVFLFATIVIFFASIVALLRLI